jgi:hypothetical protein
MHAHTAASAGASQGISPDEFISKVRASRQASSQKNKSLK